MKQRHRFARGWFLRKLRAQFLTGIIVIVPIGITILILIWVFNFIDDILRPLIMSIWGSYIPGIGFAATVILIYLAGVITDNVAGRWLIHRGEALLAKVPLVRPIYAGIKQFLQSFSKPGNGGFLQVVLIEFPMRGQMTLGFVSNELHGKSGEKLLAVFVPQAPIPTTGFLEIVREEDVIRTNISVDDAMKMVVSAGTVTPAEIGDRFSIPDHS